MGGGVGRGTGAAVVDVGWWGIFEYTDPAPPRVAPSGTTPRPPRGRSGPLQPIYDPYLFKNYQNNAKYSTKSNINLDIPNNNIV